MRPETLPARVNRSPLILRRFSSDKVKLVNALVVRPRVALERHAAGMSLEFSLCADHSELYRTGDHAVELRGESGMFTIDAGVELIRALTGIPLNAQVEPEQTDWLMATAAALLPEPFAGLFTSLRLTPAREQVRNSDVELVASISVRTDDHLFTTHAYAPWCTWRRLLRNTHRGAALDSRWSARLRSMPLDTALVAGRHVMSCDSLRKLVVGDIVVLQEALFDIEGRGLWCVGPWHMKLRSVGEQTLEVRAVEISEQSDNVALDHAHQQTSVEVRVVQGLDQAADMAAEEGEAHFAPTAALPVRMQFEIGVISISLRELESLEPGAIVRLQGAAQPPLVSIRAGGNLLGQGELIDIDGRLGVQILSWDRS